MTLKVVCAVSRSANGEWRMAAIWLQKIGAGCGKCESFGRPPGLDVPGTFWGCAILGHHGPAAAYRALVSLAHNLLVPARLLRTER